MMIDDHGNALGHWEDKEAAFEDLLLLFIADPSAINEVVIMSYDEEGMPVEVYPRKKDK